MKGLLIKPFRVVVGLDEKENVQLSVSHVDKQGNTLANLDCTIKQAEDIAYGILSLIYKTRDNVKLPDIKVGE